MYQCTNLILYTILPADHVGLRIDTKSVVTSLCRSSYSGRNIRLPRPLISQFDYTGLMRAALTLGQKQGTDRRADRQTDGQQTDASAASVIS